MLVIIGDSVAVVCKSKNMGDTNLPRNPLSDTMLSMNSNEFVERTKRLGRKIVISEPVEIPKSVTGMESDLFLTKGLTLERNGKPLKWRPLRNKKSHFLNEHCDIRQVRGGEKEVYRSSLSMILFNIFCEEGEVITAIGNDIYCIKPTPEFGLKEYGSSGKTRFLASIDGFIYIISENRVRETAYKISGSGYKEVSRSPFSTRVARCVFYAWNGSIDDGMHIDHKDRDRLNDHYYNLRQVTQKVNNQNRGKGKSHNLPYYKKLSDLVTVNGYPRYQIDSNGNVMNSNTGKYLKHMLRGSYRSVSLYREGGSQGKHFPVHRLVAEHHVTNPDGKPIVNHIDHDKLNCRSGNLEWSTQSENIKAYWANKKRLSRVNN